MKPSTIKLILIAAGLSNITAVPIFSRLFSNDALNAADPAVMSDFGLLMIMVWGLAYIAASKNAAAVKWLIGVFAIEKLAYAVNWGLWISKNSLADVYAQDMIAGIFYSIYGLNDLIFFALFALIFVKLRSAN